jgi:hypothetical protein
VDAEPFDPRRAMSQDARPASKQRLGGIKPSEAMAIKHVAYHNATILRVSTDSLEYLDDEGITCTIDFQTCHENVQKELRGPGWIRVREECVASEALQDIYVGFRDFAATPMHITLASDPPTRFEFADYCVFREFQMRLREGGVTTLDMA